MHCHARYWLVSGHRWRHSRLDDSPTPIFTYFIRDELLTMYVYRQPGQVLPVCNWVYGLFDLINLSSRGFVATANHNCHSRRHWFIDHSLNVSLHCRLRTYLRGAALSHFLDTWCVLPHLYCSHFTPFLHETNFLFRKIHTQKKLLPP